MNSPKLHTGVRLLVIAVQVALLGLAAIGSASAADEEDASVRQLTEPTDWVEIGIGYVSDDSYRFGQYNGLQDQGVYGILNLYMRGGGSYDNDSATRWMLSVRDAGLDTRELKAEYGVQGKFRIEFGYDELRANRSDSYQTPYQGAGTDTLTLPANWLKPFVPQVSSSALNFRSLLPEVSQGPALINGVLVQPTPAQLLTLINIAAVDGAAFHEVPLGIQRERTRGGFRYQLSRHWDFNFSAEVEDKDGLKAMGTVSSQIREFGAIIPDPVDQRTQQYNVGLNYTDDKSFMQLAYYVSLFDNHIDSVTWSDVNDVTKSATMSSAPSNEAHQVSITGGYNFSAHTKLVGYASYGRNTQNVAFLDNAQLPLGLPASSLHGLVVNRVFNLTLTSRPMDELNLVFGLKYDDHDNQTPVNTYYFYDANEARSAAASPFNAVLGLAPNTLGSNINIYANRPYSKLLEQFDASADYRFTPGQSLKAKFQYQKIDRDCDGSWISCSDAPRTRESMGLLEWRMDSIENLSTSLSYSHARRSVDYDENAFLALVPMAGYIPAGGATMSVYDYLLLTGLTGFGPALGWPTSPLTGDAAIFSPNNNIVPQALYGSRNNINELLGLRRYNLADRDLDKVRARLEWQASDKLAFDASFEYTDNDYTDSLYGLTRDTRSAFNLDAAYAIRDNISADLFYTYEEAVTDSASRAYGANSNGAFVGVAGNTVVQGGCYATVQARNNNNKIDVCQEWQAHALDRVHTFGATLSWKGLMGGKLELSGDVVASLADTNVDVSGGSYVNNPLAVAGGPVVTPAVIFIPAANYPAVTTDSVELRLNSRWTLGPASSLRVSYLFGHFRSSDFAYDGQQFGSLAIVMPTGQTAPKYNIHAIGLSYIYSWQ